jgi:peptide/nickel transport system permease protein
MVTKLVVRRLTHLVPILLGLTLIAFALIHLTPGDPAQGLLAQRVTPELIAQVRHQLGLDLPLWQQYLVFVLHAAQGNLGYSYRLHENVNILVADGLPVTLFLVVYAGCLALLLGVPFALVAAAHRDHWPDRLVRGGLVLTFSLPSFWVAVLLVGLALRSQGLLPSGGYGSDFIDHLWHLLLPSLTLSLTFLVVLVRSLRASLMEVMDSDYVALARLKGMGTARLLTRHVLPNAISPAITILGLDVGFLLGATVVVESVFGINGLGNILVQGVLARDYQLVQGLVLVFGLLVIVINLLVDVTQVALDPRRREPVA